jgi:hypothetical protein
VVNSDIQKFPSNLSLLIIEMTRGVNLEHHRLLMFCLGKTLLRSACYDMVINND